MLDSVFRHDWTRNYSLGGSIGWSWSTTELDGGIEDACNLDCIGARGVA